MLPYSACQLYRRVLARIRRLPDCRVGRLTGRLSRPQLREAEKVVRRQGWQPERACAPGCGRGRCVLLHNRASQSWQGSGVHSHRHSRPRAPPQLTYPLDIIRFRMAVDPTLNTIPQVVRAVIRDEGLGAFYKGLIPSCIGIMPYSSINFAAFDLCEPPEALRLRAPWALTLALPRALCSLKKALPEDMSDNSTAVFVCSLAAAALARALLRRVESVLLTPSPLSVRPRAGATLWTPFAGRCS